jgi:hypothetical protein
VRPIARTLGFAAFTLTEYIRSGRIVVELILLPTVIYLFFRRFVTPPPSEYFFTTAGLFTLALTFYTCSAILGLGDRPQGYVVLARRLGRSGYLLGLYCAALAVVWLSYGALSAAVALYNPAAGLDVTGWLLGSAPLLLNTALLGALLVLLAPMVLTPGWRLAVLAVVAVAFSGSLIGGPTLASLPPVVATGIDVLRTVFSTPLLPAFTGFALSVSRDYSGLAYVVPIAQLFLTLGLLTLAVYTFARREIIFTGA